MRLPVSVFQEEAVSKETGPFVSESSSSHCGGAALLELCASSFLIVHACSLLELFLATRMASCLLHLQVSCSPDQETAGPF